jgi:hypothetical protein
MVLHVQARVSAFSLLDQALLYRGVSLDQNGLIAKYVGKEHMPIKVLFLSTYEDGKFLKATPNISQTVGVVRSD